MLITKSPLALSSEERRKLSAPALRTFSHIALLWDLTEHQQCAVLGLANPARLAALGADLRGGNDVEVNQNLLERISHVLGIYKAINIVLPIPERADGWMHKPNTAPSFAGRRAIDLVASGDLTDLAFVHQYLLSQLT